jgi:hypothetical protein
LLMHAPFHPASTGGRIKLMLGPPSSGFERLDF